MFPHSLHQLSNLHPPRWLQCAANLQNHAATDSSHQKNARITKLTAELGIYLDLLALDAHCTCKNWGIWKTRDTPKNTGFDGFKAYNNFSVACILYGEGFIKNYDEYEKSLSFVLAPATFIQHSKLLKKS